MSNPKDSSPVRTLVREVTAQVAEKIEHLKVLFRQETALGFEIGDSIVELVDQCGCKQSFLAEKLGRSEATISDYATIARLIPPAVRRLDVPFTLYMVVVRAARRVSTRTENATGKPYPIDVVAAVDDIVARKLTMVSDMIRYLRNKARESSGCEYRCIPG